MRTSRTGQSTVDRLGWDAFVVGLAASVGAGISMGFAEALSDDGSRTERGHPWVRGVVCGAMTAPGGIGQHRSMETPPQSAALQVGLGGGSCCLRVC